jgi:hypothetical protein
VGVDPVTFLCEQAKQHANLIINNFFGNDIGLEEGTEFDVITSVSCFYDMPEPSKFVEDVKAVLALKGVWVIQQNYLLTTMELSAVDNFCHEHLEYYTLLSLENLLDRFGLEVNEVHLSMVNGGSLRTIVSRKGMYAIDPSVAKQRRAEFDAELNFINPYREFAENVMNELTKLRNLVIDLHSQGKTIYILAASTRGATIWQSAGIDQDLIEFAVERNPAKVGKWFNAIGVPIISEEQARVLKPDYMIIGPWFFADEIIKREKDYLTNGGHLIKPLPEVTIL